MMKLFSFAIAAGRYFSSQAFPKNKSKIRKSGVRNPRIRWNDQQSEVLSSVSEGKSVFVTGAAGTGKTALLQTIVSRLKKLHGRSNVFVTASTGVAACLLRGQTLHSFAGVGLGGYDRQALLDKVLNDKSAYRRWNKARALVIDEISTIDPEFFESLEYIARKIRGEAGPANKVWGGIQLVVGGDFFQLPPIFKEHRRKEFAFEADCWDSSFDLQVELTEIFRQSESQLMKLLHNIRRGDSNIDKEDLEILKKCPKTAPDSSVVRLYPRTKDVDRVNQDRMKELTATSHVYRAFDRGEDSWKRQLKQGITPDELVLAKGARVMLTMNLHPSSKNLVNGATGTVAGFRGPDGEDVSDVCESKVLPVVKFDSGTEMTISPRTWDVMDGDKVVATRKQVPLALAWAMSIHKCQGLTLDSLHTDLSRAFGYGMVYVALSRVRRLEGLHISGFDPSKIRAHPKVLKFYERFSGNGGAIDVAHETSPVNEIPAELSSLCKPNASLVKWHNNVTRSRVIRTSGESSQV